LEFISAFDNKEAGRKKLNKVTQPKQNNNRNYKGFNLLFCLEDQNLLLNALRGEYNISGFRNKDARMKLPGFSTGKLSGIIKRLKVFEPHKKKQEEHTNTKPPNWEKSSLLPLKNLKKLY
jgi:hypothetical protein